MFGADEFGPEFQRALARACVDDPGLRSLVRRFADSGQLAFTDPASAWAWRVIADTDHPTVLALRTEAFRLPPTDPARAGAQVVIDADDWRDSEYVRGQVVEWCRKQVFQAGFNEAAASWNAGDVEKAYDTMWARLGAMTEIRLEHADRGWFFEEFGERQARRMIRASGADTYPIGIEQYDNAMHGGLSKGELEVPIAYSKVGKSFWCTNRGFVAARMRAKVLHFVLEGGRGYIEDRYEAAWTDLLYTEVRVGDIDLTTMSRMQSEYRILREGLVVRGKADAKEWRVSVDFISGELQTLRESRGWVPDMVIVDYGDLLDDPHYESEREKQTAGFSQLKALAQREEGRGHRGYAVCSPSQAQRPGKGADEREHVLKPEDIADSYGKVKVADAIPSINRTRKEKECEQARVYLGGYRDNLGGCLVRVATNYPRGIFAKLGAPEPEAPDYEDED